MINHTFFDQIDDEQSAYWLGFYCADGHMHKSKRQLSFTLSSRDKLHLERLASLFDRSVKETRVFDTRTKRTYGSVRLTLSCKHLCQAILNYGIPQQKTKELNGEVFRHLPINLTNHFALGYFDGDGCITRLGKAEYHLTIVGTQPFLIALSQAMTQGASAKQRNVSFGGGVHRVSWCGTDELNKIKEWLYKDASLYLERKKAVFDTLPEFRGSSRHKGVYWIKVRNRWLARIYADGKMKTIGQYLTEEEAIAALTKGR